LREAVLGLVSDFDAQVRLQTALSVGELEKETGGSLQRRSSGETKAVLAALKALLLRDLAHTWSRRAVYCSLRPSQEKFLLQQLLQPGALDHADTNASLKAIEELSDLVGARTSESIAALFDPPPGRFDWLG
jgi:hypothetical protein